MENNKLTTNQKVIKVGSSDAITIPAKIKKQLDIKSGDTVKVTFELPDQPSSHDIEVVKIAQKLIARHNKALKNLSQR